MANEQNLIPCGHKFTREEAKRGQQRSAEVRRMRKSLRATAELFLSLPVTNPNIYNGLTAAGVDPDDATNQMAMIAGLAMKAMQGDAKAAQVVFDLLGGEIEKQETPDDGFMDALKAEAGNVWEDE